MGCILGDRTLALKGRNRKRGHRYLVAFFLFLMKNRPITSVTERFLLPDYPFYPLSRLPRSVVKPFSGSWVLPQY